MFKQILRVVFNQVGIEPITTAALIAGGGSLLGGIFGGKGETEVYEPYAPLRGKFNQYSENKLGTSTPFSSNPLLGTQQPEAESAAEGAILGGLDQDPSRRQDIFDINQKYYDVRKNQLETRHAEEAKDVSNAYNRLGLVSSTPGFEAQQDLRDQQGQEFDVLEAGLQQQGIDQEMKSTALAEEIYNNYIQQAQILGAGQRGYQQTQQQFSMADIERQTQEEQSNANMVATILGNNPPQREYQPTAFDRIGQVSSGALNAILGNSNFMKS